MTAAVAPVFTRAQADAMLVAINERLEVEHLEAPEARALVNAQRQLLVAIREPRREDPWKKLRRNVKREQRSYEGKGTNKDGRMIAAAISSAYGSVVRMMDKIDAHG